MLICSLIAASHSELKSTRAYDALTGALSTTASSPLTALNGSKTTPVTSCLAAAAAGIGREADLKRKGRV